MECILILLSLILSNPLLSLFVIKEREESVHTHTHNTGTIINMGLFSKHFTNAMIPDQSGKVAVVTGANTGLGYHVALQLAIHGCRVYLACRSEKRATDAMARLREDAIKLTNDIDRKVDIHYLPLELSNLKANLLEKESKIDILVNNAAIMVTPYELSPDGIEGQFATNHLGPYHFTARLLEAIRAAGTPDRPSRIIFTSSVGHNLPPKGGVQLTLAEINDEARISLSRPMLANILTAKYYAKLFEEESEQNDGRLSVLVNSVHPGSVRTELARHARRTFGWFGDMLFRVYYYFAGISAADGALTTLYAVTSREIEEKRYSGMYFVPYGEVKTPSDYACNEQLRDDVWNFSKELIASKLAE
ncbi:hypothetical protein BDF22DRAFT_701449 [Syncephalis plumigaleata]|nr:hypothetical protein BDF22DRAFT_701449 [Syncephalis plumigaleata]